MRKEYLRLGAILIYCAVLYGVVVPGLMNIQLDAAVWLGIVLGLVGGVAVVGYGVKAYRRAKAISERGRLKNELNL